MRSQQYIVFEDLMNVISLFSGAGGLDLGLEAAGFKTCLAVEIDADCRATLQRNRPHWNATATYGGDLTKFSPRELASIASLQAGDLDLMAGGPPCQSFSNMGNRAGFEDTRGQLIQTYFRLVRALQPRAFMFENVQGILQHDNVIKYIERMLERRYSVSMRLINAADYGVPQIRKRVIIIGLRGNTRFEFPTPTHADIPSIFGLHPWLTVRDAFGTIPPGRRDCPDNLRMRHSDIMVKRMAMIQPGRNFHALPMELRPECWRNGLHQGADTFGRLEWDRPSVTIRTCGFNPTKGRYIHPVEHRGLSTLEMAALQTFPSNYVFYGGIGSVGKQIGNAVPPKLAEALGNAIFQNLSCRRREVA